MQLPQYPSVSLHNVAELSPADWADDGDRLGRLPTDAAAGLNEDARHRVSHATGSELRFVPSSDEDTIEITLSSPEEGQIRIFWGDFQPWKPSVIGPEPRTFELSVPDRLKKLDPEDNSGRFDHRVCRILFERIPPVAVHGVEGDCRPPTDDELPDTRYLAYGTSITEGAASSATHLNYVSRVARELGYDALNFGCSGCAYCDEAMADYVASRDDWDVATLALSINMANQGFAVEEFRDRASEFVDRVASAHPDKPIACITLFPFYPDVVEGGDAERAEEYREVLRTIVAESPHSNLSLVEGNELMEISELGVDLLHPGDAGMEAIGRGLAGRLDDVTE